jgi:hypothetical protein
VNPLKWKILIPIVVLAVVALLFLSYYFQSSIDTGLLLSIIPIASPFIFYALDYYQKARVNLQISNAQFLENKISENITGYQLKVRVTNKGKKICLNVTAQFDIRTKEGKPISLMLARIENANGRINTSTSEEPFSQVKYAWFDDKDKQSNGDQLRQNDNYFIIFPYDKSGGAIVFGLFDGGGSSSFSSRTERLLNILETNYEVKVELKEEDLEKNTYTKKQTFNLSLTKLPKDELSK